MKVILRKLSVRVEMVFFRGLFEFDGIVCFEQTPEFIYKLGKSFIHFMNILWKFFTIFILYKYLQFQLNGYLCLQIK